jgi:hypothetical protein
MDLVPPGNRESPGAILRAGALVVHAASRRTISCPHIMSISCRALDVRCFSGETSL